MQIQKSEMPLTLINPNKLDSWLTSYLQGRELASNIANALITDEDHVAIEYTVQFGQTVKRVPEFCHYHNLQNPHQRIKVARWQSLCSLENIYIARHVQHVTNGTWHVYFFVQDDFQNRTKVPDQNAIIVEYDDFVSTWLKISHLVAGMPFMHKL
jgi:hypothetical protein